MPTCSDSGISNLQSTAPRKRILFGSSSGLKYLGSNSDDMYASPIFHLKSNSKMKRKLHHHIENLKSSNCVAVSTLNMIFLQPLLPKYYLGWRSCLQVLQISCLPFLQMRLYKLMFLDHHNHKYQQKVAV